MNPVKAGPYDLGQGLCDCVVVRAKIGVDPHTAQVTVFSDPIPHILQGIPLQVKHVNVTVDRENFVINPTRCNPMSITGTATGYEGGSANLSVPFQVTNCAALKFRPKFSASTSAKTSRHNGAKLHVSLAYPKAPFGTQANIKSVHVELPKVLPSRLSTLNRACLDSVFNQNPASCPVESRVGFAKAVTPVLPVPLEGPAYFVSHGGQKFPELIVVLQGYGVTVDLEGETFISKAGITSSTFKSVPDVPVGTFELTLPQGKFSALAANGNLCFKTVVRHKHRVRQKVNLVMPTTFVAQNGAVLKQNTKIGVEGCAKPHRAKRAAKKKHGKGH